MTSRARLRGLTLSVLMHAGAAAALVAGSTAEWTRPLVVDLLQGAQPAPGGDAPRPTARPAPQATSRVARSSAQALRSTPPTPRAPVAAPAPEPVAPAPLPPPAAQARPTPADPPPLPPTPVAPPAPAAPPTVATPPAEPAPASSSGPGRSGAPDPRSGAVGETRGDSATAMGTPGAPLALAKPGGSGLAAEYGPYYQRFWQRVHQALVYPLAARRQGLSGTVELDVLIEATGRVRDIRIVRSSTHRLLDDAALEAIRGLGAVPFPAGLPPRSLLVRIPLVFELR